MVYIIILVTRKLIKNEFYDSFTSSRIKDLVIINLVGTLKQGFSFQKIRNVLLVSPAINYYL